MLHSRQILGLVFLLALGASAGAQAVRLRIGEVGVRAPLAEPASELRVETTPSTAWLDFDRLAFNRWIPGDLPDWLEPVAAETRTGADGTTTTTFRLRFQQLRDSPWEIQLRLFFDDEKGTAPTVTAWAESGAPRFTCGPLGVGLGLPNSETLTFPAAGTARVEITVPGDGHHVRGVFLALLAAQEVRHALDFAPPAELADPFGGAPATLTQAEDHALFGRVKAVIDAGGLKLVPDAAQRGTWEFPLESPPLLAVVTFEVLNADALAPLDLTLNDRPLGAVSVQWPDLADPGYLGLARALEQELRFRYTGWLRCQKVIPGSALRAGANRMILQLHSDSGAIAIRAVEIELKYSWKSLDYTLSPTLP